MNYRLYGCVLAALTSHQAVASNIGVGAAPPGDAKVIANRIIRANFPSCSQVEQAKRLKDGSITAECARVRYRVFTVFDPGAGKMHEVAMNCNAAQRLSLQGC